jgi:hypothetical protein
MMQRAVNIEARQHWGVQRIIQNVSRLMSLVLRIFHQIAPRTLCSITII